MTTTLAIAPKRVRLYRMLWDRWIIVLRILFDLGAGAHPVKWRSVADTLLVDKKTCQKYLAGLVREGHITAAGEGYMLTQSGFDILLENEQGEFLPSSGEKFPGKNSQLLESVVVVDSELNLIPTTTTKLGKIPGEKLSPADEQVGRFFSADVQAALDHADLLFDGSQVAQQGLDYYLHIEKVLGWLAYCYDRRGSLYGPAGLVRKNLKDPAAPMPSMKYMKDPLAFFPDEFLDAIGKWEGHCPLCRETFTSKKGYDEHLQNFRHPEPEEDEPMDSALEADETVTQSVLDTWQDVLVNMQGEMARASFETWVKDTFPVHYEDGVMQVAARNAYARDWLGSRMSQRIGELAGCRVTFVVAMETEPVYASA